MKKNTSFLFFLFAFCLPFCRGQALERIALEHALANKDSTLYIQGSAIYINKDISQSPSLSYFSNKQWWHIKGTLKVGCYDKHDSLRNVKFAKKKYVLNIRNKKIKLVEDKLLKSVNSVKAYVYKRFYYCGGIYILILLKDVSAGINTEILVSFGLDNKFLSLSTHSYVN